MTKNKVELKPNETLEDLCFDGLKIIQNKELYRFTSDAVILANFVSAKPTESLLDLGTGSGVIAILSTSKNKLSHTVAVEIQPQMFDMARRNVTLNGLDDKIKVVNCDMKNFVCEKEFDVVVCNPPYKKIIGERTKINVNPSKQIARHEVAITLQEICQVASKNLKFGGKFFVCLDADRVAELLFDLKSCGLEPKKMFFTQSSEKSNAKIVFVQAVKGGKEGVQVLPMLITNDLDGSYLETVKKMRFN